MSTLTPNLRAFRKEVTAKLPGITVEEHPYTIGYWSCRAKIAPWKRIARGADLAEFNEGCEQAKKDMEDES